MECHSPSRMPDSPPSSTDQIEVNSEHILQASDSHIRNEGDNRYIPTGIEDSTSFLRMPAHGSMNDTSSPLNTSTSLPPILRVLFGLNGLSLSLLMLPIMYILNTRVEVPVPYLPAYGALAFLPYSLKPIYAYLCGVLSSFPSEVQDIENKNYDSVGRSRYLRLFSVLLTFNSLCTASLTLIPKGGVMAMFSVAFIRGFTDSWAEFCLGLSLIDHARFQARQQYNTLCDYSSYDSIVSKLQSQSATAGNLGSWLASFVTCMLFLERYLADRNSDGEQVHQQLSGRVANGLILLTSSIQLLAAIMVHFYARGNLPSWSRSGVYQEIQPAEIPTDNTNINADRLNCPTESDSLRDEESSHPSYSSLEDLADDEGSMNSSISDDLSGNARYSPNESQERSSSTKLLYGILVALLQSILVLIGLKGPIVEWSSHFTWQVSLITLAFGIGVTVLALCCGNHQSTNTHTLRVGLYLVLRNAVPSDSMIVASFFYSLFGESQPFILQLLSFFSMAVSSLSSWTYTNLFSTKFSVGHSLLILMAGTIVLSSMASLLNIAVFREYQHNATELGENDDASAPNIITSRLLLVAALSKFITTFFDEWAFLPELVLATTSVKTSSSSSPTPIVTAIDHAGTVDAEHVQDEEVELSPLPTSHRPLNHRNHEQCPDSADTSDDDKRIAMEYGALVSCIDFGDQLGSLTAAPLVAILNISRENQFLHLDRLILICALTNVVVTIGLLPLVMERQKR